MINPPHAHAQYMIYIHTIITNTTRTQNNLSPPTHSQKRAPATKSAKSSPAGSRAKRTGRAKVIVIRTIVRRTSRCSETMNHSNNHNITTNKYEQIHYLLAKAWKRAKWIESWAHSSATTPTSAQQPKSNQTISTQIYNALQSEPIQTNKYTPAIEQGVVGSHQIATSAPDDASKHMLETQYLVSTTLRLTSD